MRYIYKVSAPHILAGAALAAFCLLGAGCDNVDQKDRFIDYPLPEASRVELIMEFTGQRCSNCPDGAKVIHQLQEAFPDGVAAVCLHPIGVEYTRPDGPDLGLRSELATEVYKEFAPPSFPFAVFDGQVTDQSRTYLQWSKAATDFLSVPTPVVLEAEAAYDSERNITVEANFKFVRGEYSYPLNIAVWLMENGIVGRQISSTGTVRDYVHNHVARTSLNGTWGVPIGSSFAFEQEMDYSVSLAGADAKWKLENCQAVVFLVDPVSKNVVQTAVADLLPAMNL